MSKLTGKEIIPGTSVTPPGDGDIFGKINTTINNIRGLMQMFAQYGAPPQFTAPGQATKPAGALPPPDHSAPMPNPVQGLLLKLLAKYGDMTVKQALDAIGDKTITELATEVMRYAGLK